MNTLLELPLSSVTVVGVIAFGNAGGSLNASICHNDKLHLGSESYHAWFKNEETIHAEALGEMPLPRITSD